MAGLGDRWDAQEMGQEGGAKGGAPVPNLGKEAAWDDGVNLFRQSRRQTLRSLLLEVSVSCPALGSQL